MNCKKSIVSNTVYGRRHSKLFTNCHVSCDTLYLNSIIVILFSYFIQFIPIWIPTGKLQYLSLKKNKNKLKFRALATSYYIAITISKNLFILKYILSSRKSFNFTESNLIAFLKNKNL